MSKHKKTNVYVKLKRRHFSHVIISNCLSLLTYTGYRTYSELQNVHRL